MSDSALSERPPTEMEVREASEAMRTLASALTVDALPFSVIRDGDKVNVKISAPIGQLMLDVLGHIARGEMVKVVPYGAELSTKEAADLLNVSRPFLIKLLGQGKIPYRKVGSHRRIFADDVLQYKDGLDVEREKALDAMQRFGQEFDRS